MCEEQQFDFEDFNLKFLELTPPRPTQGAPTAIRCLTPLSNALPQNHKKLHGRVQDLAKRIANNDNLIHQLRNLEKERKGLQQQLKDFQSSANDISKLYEAEKLERKKLQLLTNELQKQCDALTEDLTSVTFANDQLECKLEETSYLPVDYIDLSTSYMRLFSKLEQDQAQHWVDQGIAEKIRKYCIEKSLVVPEKRSPKKRKPKIKKPEIGIQCELMSNTNIKIKEEIHSQGTQYESIELRSQGTQHENIGLRSQGTQHISTTTTRSTCTSSFIKKHSVGTCFPEPLPLPAIDDMLREMLRWDIKPVSPIPNNVIVEPTVPAKKSIGTCTFICNIQRTIDYIGGSGIGSHQLLANVKNSNSRPPSRNVADRIKNEVITPPPSVPLTLHSFEPNVSSGFPQLSSSLNSLSFSTFDDLWQVFGHMLFGLLKNRSNSELSSTRPLGGIDGSSINHQEFQNWLHLMFEEMSEQNTIVSAPQHNSSELQDFRNNTTSSKDEPALHQSIGTSPIRFSDSIEDVDASFNSNEELSYPATASTAVLPTDLPNLDGAEFTKIHIPTKTKINKKNQRRKCSEYRDNVVNEILDLFPPLECTKEKKIKIAKLLKNHKKSDANKLASPPDEHITAESPRNLSENAVDFLTQLGTTVNETNNVSKDLLTEHQKIAKNITVNLNLNVPTQNNEFSKIKNLPTTKVNQKLETKLVNRLFGSDTDETSFETDSETDEAINLKIDITEKPNINDEEFIKEEEFTTDGRHLIANHTFEKETSLLGIIESNNRMLLSKEYENKTVDLCKQSTIRVAMSELKFEFDNDASNVNEISENNLIIDESYDAGSSHIEVSTDCLYGEETFDTVTKTKICCQQQISAEETKNIAKQHKSHEFEDTALMQYNSANTGETKNHNTTKSPIISSSALNNILTTSTNQLVEALLKSDSIFDNLNENQLQRVSTDINPLSLSPVSVEASTAENVTSKTPRKRGRKRKIDICRSPTTALTCKRSDRLKGKQIATETTDLTPQTPLRKYSLRNRHSSEQSELRECNFTGESKQYEPFSSSGFFKQRNTEVNCKLRENVIKQETAKKFEKKCLELEEDSQQLGSNFRVSLTQQINEEHRKLCITEEKQSQHGSCNSTSSCNKFLQNKTDVASQESQSMPETICDYLESPSSPSIEENNAVETSVSCNKFLQNKTDVATQESQSMPETTCDYLESPSSPSIEENNAVETSVAPIKEIPLEIDRTHYSFESTSVLKSLCRNYNNKMHSIVISKSSSSKAISKAKQEQFKKLSLRIQEFLTITTNESELDLASFVLVEEMKQITNKNLTEIASVIVEQMKDVPRPETELGCNIADIPPKYLGKLHRKISYVMRRLQLLMPEFSTELLCAIENKLFNFKDADKFSLSCLLNLTQLYLLTISNQLPQMQTNPARLFISKCLYFHKLRATPMIYEVLCCFPTSLPHREDRTYDHSDALINVIQHILMCTKYDMDKVDLRTRDLLSKLRFEYHFEAFKPDQQEILNNLLQKIEAGKLDNVSFAFALLCKRLPQSKVETDVLQAKLLPLANEYYPIVLNSSSHDARIGCLLESISMIVKAFALDTNISVYSKMFARFLNAVERPAIQEAAVQAILRMQRFGCSNCYNELINFKPSYELQPITRAMLQTFVYRRPSIYWKKIYYESTTGTSK